MNVAVDSKVQTGRVDLHLMLRPEKAMKAGGQYPELMHALPVYLPKISPDSHLKWGRLRLNLKIQTTYFLSKPNNQQQQDSNNCPYGNKISSLAS
jgi:hypothetical protein